MTKPLLCSSKKAEKLLRNYNVRPIVPFNAIPVRKLLPSNARIYTSCLPRAIETATRLFPNADTLPANPVFNEYGLTIVRVPLLPLPYDVWTSLSRVLWVLHLNQQGETRQSARSRMKKASGYLEHMARKDGKVVLVGHGYMIAEMRRELKRRGWKTVSAQGNKNLAVTHLVKLGKIEN